MHADNQLAWPRLLKRLFFPLWNYLNTLVKNQLPINTDSRFRSIDLYVCPYASTTAFPLPQFCGELFFFLDFIYLFLERVERKEKERERNISVWLPLTCPLVGTWPTTHICALTGNRTGDPLVCSLHAQSTEPHQPGLCRKL